MLKEECRWFKLYYGADEAEILIHQGKTCLKLKEKPGKPLIELSKDEIPENLNELVNQNQIGLVMLKIVEIIGEDNISNLDPETLYFLNKIFNNLNLKKIRNNILSEALPIRI